MHTCLEVIAEVLQVDGPTPDEPADPLLVDGSAPDAADPALILDGPASPTSDTSADADGRETDGDGLSSDICKSFATVELIIRRGPISFKPISVK